MTDLTREADVNVKSYYHAHSGAVRKLDLIRVDWNDPPCGYLES
jgi:hypothetical protein